MTPFAFCDRSNIHLSPFFHAQPEIPRLTRQCAMWFPRKALDSQPLIDTADALSLPL